MSMTEWAEREVELACARERKFSSEKCEWDYGCACYQSALKAYKSLMEDGHSGYSFSLTKHILIRLMDELPLTPIEDTDDIWNHCIDRNNDEKYSEYQCKRKSSLFKRVYDDGRVTYSDIYSHYCVSLDNPSSTYHSGLVRRIVDEMFPVTMPYMPGKPFKVICEDILTDEKNGDFDTVAIYDAVRPDGETIVINRYFKESEDGWTEIDSVEFLERKEKHLARIKRIGEKV